MNFLETISQTISWSYPLTFFFMLLLGFTIKGTYELINIRKVLKKRGIEVTYDLFGSYFNGCLRWTAVHEVKTAVIICVILLTGVLMTVHFK